MNVETNSFNSQSYKMKMETSFHCFLAALILSLYSVKGNSPKTDQVDSVYDSLSLTNKVSPSLLNKGSAGVCSGIPGIPGTPGQNGLPGRNGLQGQKGNDGTKGAKGDKGATGKMGPKGNLGERGPIGIGQKGNLGDPGPQGENGTVHSINWKQYVWRREDAKDTGLIQVVYQ